MAVNTETGTGSHVRATSPTLVTPVLGAATATTIALGGNEAFTYDEGSFTATLTGVSGTVTGTAYFTRIGKAVTLYLPGLFGTSNTTACTITGMPASILPARYQVVAVQDVVDNSTSYSGSLYIQTSGIINLAFRAAASGSVSDIFTNSGNKGLNDVVVVAYTLQ
jgi:hypothetical protein